MVRTPFSGQEVEAALTHNWSILDPHLRPKVRSIPAPDVGRDATLTDLLQETPGSTSPTAPNIAFHYLAAYGVQFQHEPLVHLAILGLRCGWPWGASEHAN